MQNKRRTIILIISLVIFAVSLYLALFAGYKDSGLNLLAKAFGIQNDSDSIILSIIRYPRAIKAVIAGGCLALSGLFMQAVTRNPLAEPYITGVSSGAAIAIVLSVLYGVSTSYYSVFGFMGAILSSLIVIAFAGINKFSISKLILTGLSVNIFVSSLISLIILTHSDKAYTMLLILSGGVTNNTIISDKNLFGLFIFALCLSVFLIPKLNFIRLDSELVSAFKKKRNIYVFLTIATSAFLASLSVFSAGILGFIGIIIPQISRMLMGEDFRWLFFSNILLGSSLVLFSDFIARTAFYPLEIPLGLIIAFLGSPVFIFFLTRKGTYFYD